MRQHIHHGGNPSDANYIFVEPMCSRSKEEMIMTYKKVINRMRLAGFGLKIHTFNNKALEAFKQYIQDQQMQYKLFPPGNHQRNQAVRAIQTFKVHFILILAGINNKFPLSLWCHLLKPIKLTLNLLCQSKVAPKISATHTSTDHMTT